MYRYFMDYDLTEYKVLENKLNELSLQGINPVNLGLVSSFKKNNKHYYYYVDIFTKKASVPKKKAMNDMINYYERHMFDYIGKIGKLMIFRSENKRQLLNDRKKEINEVLNIREISCLTYFVLTLIPTIYLVYSFLSHHTISEFLTNGSIILHYGIVVIALTFILRPLHKLILAHQYKKEKRISSRFLNKIFYTCVIISIIILSLGCLLDITGREKVKVDNEVITLGDLGLKDDFKNYDEYTITRSYITDSYSYAESNDQGDAIYSKKYVIHQKKDIQKYFDNYKKEIIDNKSISINASVYIINIDGQNDSILFKTKDGFIYVTTSLEIYESKIYLKIIDFYKKSL